MTTLPSKAKVVIIGGGIHGLSTAWKLSETYKNPGDIVVLEKKDVKGKIKTGADVQAAGEVGKLVAKRASEAGVKDVIFDRGGYKFHGRVKALAEAAREAGLSF